MPIQPFNTETKLLKSHSNYSSSNEHKSTECISTQSKNNLKFEFHNNHNNLDYINNNPSIVDKPYTYETTITKLTDNPIDPQLKLSVDSISLNNVEIQRQILILDHNFCIEDVSAIGHLYPMDLEQPELNDSRASCELNELQK
eukprot:CAMPEP_0116946844 /NCGR_PEP_ID=MMETSP0467-20121206/37262_1 /TAXON_ID=283647 /ORGANISM="Mesodinium pulex, Strain SPMC105" /LENGTH=142 /DNA_ID=CAMNT_0004630769 /DNA_START=250 /DNA_END=678 /DNA_ORIENTATION=+